MKVNHVTMLEYKYLFGSNIKNRHAEILALINDVNFDIAFPIIARLNYVVREGSLKNYSDEITFWFGFKSPLVDVYTQLIAQGYDEKEHSSLRILNIWSNLALLQSFLEVYKNSTESKNQNININNTHDRLLKAYLLINEEYVANFNSQKVIASIPNGVGLVMKNGLTMATMLLPYHDLNHIDAADAMIAQFIKAVYFLQFAETNLPKALTEFLTLYGISTWQDYMKAVFPIVGHALQNNKEGLGYLTINSDNPHGETSRKFLSNISIESQNGDFSQHDFILPRSKPLMQINMDKYLVIDNLLIYNKMYNSLFFEFKKVLIDNPDILGKMDFKGYLNDHFSESFLASKVLNTVFENSKYLKFSGEEIRKAYAPTFKAEPDYYARNGNDLFMFELKDTLINGTTKQSFNVELIKNELKSKLWFKSIDKKGEIKEEPKAIRQLQNNIRRAAVNALPFDNDLEYRFLKVYPVLLYIDQSLSTPGINEILQQWFAEELAHDVELGKVQDRFDIMPLTMIDLDTLIVFQDDFKSGKLKLEELIPRFWGYKQGLIAIGLNNINQAIFDSYISFGAFLRLNRKTRNTPKLFTSFGRLLFDKNNQKSD